MPFLSASIPTMELPRPAVPPIPLSAQALTGSGAPLLSPPPPVKIEVQGVNFFYGAKQALHSVSLEIPEKRATAFIGPSGCGKSTLLRCFNRMNDLVDGVRLEGRIRLGGQDIHAPNLDVIELRKRVGMVFQKSNPFPTMSIAENVTVGLRLNGIRNRSFLQDRMEQSLRMAALWEEVKDDLSKPGVSLSGGQQQRLCIARAIATQPEVLLMDEPASALDPIATMKVEELIQQLSRDYTIVIVTHNMQQASRVSHKTAFFYLGKLVEFNDTDQLFTRPREKQTEDYISGRFG